MATITENRKRLSCLVTATVVCLPLLACRTGGGGATDARSGGEILADDDPAAAPYAATRIQERPVFPRDEAGRRYGMAADRIDHEQLQEKRLKLEEARPETSR